MRILVTGATGFVGRHTVDELRDHTLLCIGRANRFPPGVASLKGDFGTPASWRDELEAYAPDVCVHLAWEGLPDYSEATCARNVEASLRLAEAVARVGCKRMVVAGSCWEYGAGKGALHEELIPRDPETFARAKLLLWSQLTQQLPTLEIYWARIFFVYGPGQRPNSLIPYCFDRLSRGELPDLRKPGVLQDFVFVQDVARALRLLALTGAAPGIYNVASGVGTPVWMVANEVARVLGREDMFMAPNDCSMGCWGDVRKMRDSTGWVSAIGLKQGVKKTVDILAADG